MKMMKYVIINKAERAFWSNKNGWSDFIDATRFDEVDIEICFLPADSEWIKEDDVLFDDRCHMWIKEGEED